MMKSNLISGLLVMNFDEALDFYTKKLGFVVVEDVSMGDDRWLTITLPGNHDSVIALHEARTEEDKALVGKQMGSYPFLGLDTDDCIGENQRMQGPGRKFHREPDGRPYGTGRRHEELSGPR